MLDLVGLVDRRPSPRIWHTHARVTGACPLLGCHVPHQPGWYRPLVGRILARDARGRETARRAAPRRYRDARGRPRRALPLVVRFFLRAVKLRPHHARGTKCRTLNAGRPQGGGCASVVGTRSVELRWLTTAVLVVALLG